MGKPAWSWGDNDWGIPPVHQVILAQAARLACVHAAYFALGLLGVACLPTWLGIGCGLLTAAVSLEIGRADFDLAWRVGRADVDRTRGRLSAGIYLASRLSRALGAIVVATAVVAITALWRGQLTDHKTHSGQWPSPEFLGALMLCFLFYIAPWTSIASWTITIGTTAGCLWRGKKRQLERLPRDPDLTFLPKQAGKRALRAEVKIIKSMGGSLSLTAMWLGPISIFCLALGMFDRLPSFVPNLGQTSPILLDWIDHRLIQSILVCGASSMAPSLTSCIILAVLLQKILPGLTDRLPETLATNSIRVVASISPGYQIEL